jgi:hypothetical protein
VLLMKERGGDEGTGRGGRKGGGGASDVVSLAARTRPGRIGRKLSSKEVC